MAEGKKAYYQVSFTGGQALAAVVVLMLALGVSFFLGAKAGFEKSEPEAAATSPAAAPGPAPAAPATSASTGTAVSTASESAPSTEEAPVFEDREAGVGEAPKSPAAASPSSTAPSRTELVNPPKTSAPPPPAAAAPSSPAHAPEAPAKAASEPAHKAGSGTGFYVQIVSTSSRAEANRWKEKLAARKYRTAAVSSVESSKGKLWRVRIGPYPDRTQANKAAEKITAEFRQKAWVAPE